jgi:DNA-binding transcriptional LysR family regulator
MNLRFVEAFYWAVTLKSVTRAAEKLFVTQSALSSRIAALETELGVLLLDRRDKQFRLTIAGNRFHRHAEKLLHLQREIRAELGSAGERHVSLRLGVIESVLHSWLVEWVQSLRREQPSLQLDLTVETTPVLMDQMRRGTLDLIVAALPVQGDGVDTRALAPMPMCFVGRQQALPKAVPPAGSAAGAQGARKRRPKAVPLTLSALASQHELLTFQRGSQPHVALLEACRLSGVESPRVHNISSISAMVELAEQGFGVATLPQAAVERLAVHRPLAVLPVDMVLQPLPVHLSWREDPASPIVGRSVRALLGFR